MAGYVFFKDTKSMLNRTCAILISCFSIWNFIDIFSPVNKLTVDTALLFQNISSIGWISFSSIFLCFAMLFAGKGNLLKKKWFLFLIFILPAIILYKQWTNGVTGQPMLRYYGWEFVWADTIWAYLFISYYILFSIAAIYIIFHHGIKTKNLLEKNQSRIIVATILISLILGTTTDVILPLLNIKGPPQMADVIILIFAGGMIYAIVKYKFLSITPAIAAENIISTMEEFLVLSDREGNIINVNNAVLDTLKFEQNELKGKSYEILFSESNINNSLLENISRDEIIKNREGELISSEAEKIPVIFSCSPLREKDGEIRGIVFIARDISERKKYEEVLKISEEKFRNLVETTSDIIWETNEAAQFTYVSPQVENILGYKQDELIGHLPFEFMSANEAAKIKKRSDEIIALKMPYDGLININLHKDGHQVIFETSGVPILDADNNLLGYRGIDRDITEREMAEEKLRQAHAGLEVQIKKRTAELALVNENLKNDIIQRRHTEEQLMNAQQLNLATINAINEWVYMVDREMNIIMMNDNTIETLSKHGIVANNYQGKNITDVLKFISEKELQEYEEVFSTGKMTFTEETTTINNELFITETKKIPIFDGDLVSHVVTTVYDITKLRIAEQEIVHALEKEKELNSIKSRFLNVITHEFRTPLAGILSGVQLIEKFGHKWNEEKKSNTFKGIYGAINYTNFLLDDVSLIGKDESGKLNFYPRKFNIEEFSRQINNEILVIFGTSIPVDLTIDLINREVVADPSLLRHILTNILSNAIKYSIEGGRVEFQIKEEDMNQVAFIITDHGIGIPASDIQYIAEPFFRATNAEKIKGTGLGLTIVKRCIEMHNGSFEINSRENEGTTIRIVIPFTE